MSLLGMRVSLGGDMVPLSETAATDELDSSFDLVGIRSPGKMRNQIDSLAHSMPTARHGL